MQVHDGLLKAKLLRSFGTYSEKKEIEAIAVDTLNGFVYYSDEGHCIRKYHADPAKGNAELSCFGNEDFLEDIEGIAVVYPTSRQQGYLIVSDQQMGQFNLYDLQTNTWIKAVNLGTLETDGCDVTTRPLNDRFSSGLFVAMNDDRNFYYYDLGKIIE